MQGVLRPRLKVCGLTRPGDVEALDGMVDYLGFITAPARVSPRVLPPGEAAELASTVSRSTPVLVAAAMPPGEALEAAARHVFPVLQLHHPLESVEQLERFIAESLERSVRPAPVLVRGETGWSGLSPLEASRAQGLERAEYVLLDASKSLRRPLGPRGLRLPLGEAVEAVRLLAAAGARPGLAGGVRPGNACLAASTGAWLLDTSSGVESGPGRKDPALVEALIRELEGCSVGAAGEGPA